MFVCRARPISQITVITEPQTQWGGNTIPRQHDITERHLGVSSRYRARSSTYSVLAPRELKAAPSFNVSAHEIFCYDEVLGAPAAGASDSTTMTGIKATKQGYQAGLPTTRVEEPDDWTKQLAELRHFSAKRRVSETLGLRLNASAARGVLTDWRRAAARPDRPDSTRDQRSATPRPAPAELPC